jgi:hypothetical protein
VQTPGCPLCGQDPVMVFGGGTQAWCGSDDCTILCWDATKSLDENLLDAHHVRLTSTGEDE